MGSCLIQLCHISNTEYFIINSSAVRWLKSEASCWICCLANRHSAEENTDVDVQLRLAEWITFPVKVFRSDCLTSCFRMFYSWWVSTQSYQSSEGWNTSWSCLIGPNTFWMRASLKGQFNKNTLTYFLTCLWWSFNCPAATQNELHPPPSSRCGGRNLRGWYSNTRTCGVQPLHTFTSTSA